MAMTGFDQDALAPSASEREQLAKIGHLLERERSSAPQLVVGEERVEMPAPLVRAVMQWLRSVERGDTVALVAGEKLLTTQQAADILGVSRQHLVQLLERGTMPFTKTGTHRRIRVSDLMAYKRRRDAERRAALSHLAELSEEMDLYEATATPPKSWIRLDSAEVRALERTARAKRASESDT